MIPKQKLDTVHALRVALQLANNQAREYLERAKKAEEMEAAAAKMRDGVKEGVRLFLHDLKFSEARLYLRYAIEAGIANGVRQFLEDHPKALKGTKKR